MASISDLGRLFRTSAAGRKLHRQRTDHADGVAQVDTASTIQAGIYMRGLLEAKSGDRVPGRGYVSNTQGLYDCYD
jgi:hypothetical protein